MSERMSTRNHGAGRRRAALFTVALALVTVVAAVGQTPEQDATKSARGRVTYRIYCMNCHGEQAKGDGHIASLLRVAPADLTRLTAKDGTFPAERVRKSVDGRAEIATHGQREMPVCGDFFQDGDGSPEGVAKAEAKIQDLVAYVRSIQVPADK